MAAALAHTSTGARCLQTRSVARRPSIAARPALRNVAVKAGESKKQQRSAGRPHQLCTQGVVVWHCGFAAFAKHVTATMSQL
jgi:hypothetical protein